MSNGRDRRRAGERQHCGAVKMKAVAPFQSRTHEACNETFRSDSLARMKHFILVIAVLSLAFNWCAQAQTPPKWAFTVTAPTSDFAGFVKHSVFDGVGGSAWNLQFDFNNPSVLLWLDVNGRAFYSNAFPHATLRLARFTRTELAVQVRVEDPGTGDTSTNYVLRLRKTARGVTVAQFPIGFSEASGGSVGAPSDIRGLFTSEVTAQAIVIRRYIN